MNNTRNPIWISTPEPYVGVRGLQVEAPPVRSTGWARGIALATSIVLMLAIWAGVALVGFLYFVVNLFTDTHDGPADLGRIGQVALFGVAGAVVSMITTTVFATNPRRFPPILQPAVPALVLLVAYLWLQLPY